MRAVELTGYKGITSLRIVEVQRPKPGAGEVLIEVKAAGINYAEIELSKGQYQIPKQTPFIMGFQAAGIVVEEGAGVSNFKRGDRITSLVVSGGYAEYATAQVNMAIPIPEGISFAEAATIPIQGLSAYALLKFAARPRNSDSMLIQSAGGGVGVYLVQLAKIMGVEKVIALAGSQEKLDLAKNLGADFTFNYLDRNWMDRVKAATGGKGVDIVLEAASGSIGEESFKLLAPFGRMVIFGARNVHDTFPPEKISQLIYKNQTLTGFNIPTLQPQQIAEYIPNLLQLISQRRIKLFANQSFALEDVGRAFEMMSNRQTIGTVVLVPN